MPNNSYDAQIKEFIKDQALNSDETKVEIFRQMEKEFAHLLEEDRPSRKTVERHVEKHRQGIQKLKRTKGLEWEFEPFSLGALYAHNISVPPDVVTALFSAQLQTQFCSQSFTNRDAKWLVRLKAFYDSNLRRNANGLSRYGFEGLEKLPPGTMIGGHQDAKLQGWNASILNGLIEIAKNYSQYESQFQVENGEEKKKKLETRLLDSMLIWKAAPGIGQFLAARTPITGHPFWKSANKPGALTKKNNNPASDLAESEQTMPMQLFPPSYRENNLGMQVELSAVLRGWAKENENYLEMIATKVFEVGFYSPNTYSELDFEEKIIGELFKPVFEFTKTPEGIRKKLKYNEIPDVASLPSNSLSTNLDDTDENLLLVMALDFLSARAPGVFKDFPETLARINKLENSDRDHHFDPVHNPYSHPVRTVSEVDMKYGLSELCLEFETEIEDWNPKSSIVQGSYEFPFVLGLQTEWLESSNRASELYSEAMTDWEARDDHWDYLQEQDCLLDEYRASLEARNDKDESRT